MVMNKVFMKNLANHIEIMINHVKKNVSIENFGKLMIMDTLVKVIMVVLMKKPCKEKS
jgi:hypothetical protein